MQSHYELLCQALAGDQEKYLQLVTCLNQPSAPSKQAIADCLFDENNVFYQDENFDLFFNACWVNRPLFSLIVTWWQESKITIPPLIRLNLEAIYFSEKLLTDGKFIEKLTNYSPLHTSVQVIVHTNMGRFYYSLNNFDMAILAFDNAIQCKPDHAPSYIKRSYPLLNSLQLSRAIEDCSTAIKLDPHLAEAYYNRACSYLLSIRRPQKILEPLKDLHHVMLNLHLANYYAKNNSKLQKDIQEVLDSVQDEHYYRLRLINIRNDYQPASAELSGNLILVGPRFFDREMAIKTSASSQSKTTLIQTFEKKRKAQETNLESAELHPAKKFRADLGADNTPMVIANEFDFFGELFRACDDIIKKEICKKYLEVSDLINLAKTSRAFYHLIHNDKAFQRARILFGLKEMGRSKGISVESFDEKNLLDIPTTTLNLLLTFAQLYKEDPYHRFLSVHWFANERTKNIRNETFWRLVSQWMLIHSGYTAQDIEDPLKLTSGLISYRNLAEMILATEQALHVTGDPAKVRNRLKYLIESKGFYLDVIFSTTNDALEPNTYYLRLNQDKNEPWQFIYSNQHSEQVSIPVQQIAGLEERLKKLTIDDITNKTFAWLEIGNCLLEYHKRKHSDDHLAIPIYLYSKLVALSDPQNRSPSISEILFSYKNLSLVYDFFEVGHFLYARIVFILYYTIETQNHNYLPTADFELLRQNLKITHQRLVTIINDMFVLPEEQTEFLSKYFSGFIANFDTMKQIISRIAPLGNHNLIRRLFYRDLLFNFYRVYYADIRYLFRHVNNDNLIVVSRLCIEYSFNNLSGSKGKIEELLNNTETSKFLTIYHSLFEGHDHNSRSLELLKNQQLVRFIIPLEEEYRSLNRTEKLQLNAIISLYEKGWFKLTNNDRQLIIELHPFLSIIEKYACHKLLFKAEGEVFRKRGYVDLSSFRKILVIPNLLKLKDCSVAKITFFFNNFSLFDPQRVNGPLSIDLFLALKANDKCLMDMILPTVYNSSQLAALLSYTATFENKLARSFTKLLEKIKDNQITFERLMSIIKHSSLLTALSSITQVTVIIENCELNEIESFTKIAFDNYTLLFVLGSMVPRELLIQLLGETNKNPQLLLSKIKSNAGLMILTQKFVREPVREMLVENLSSYTFQQLEELAKVRLPDGTQFLTQFLSLRITDKTITRLTQSIKSVIDVLIKAHHEDYIFNFIRAFTFRDLLEQGSVLKELYQSHCNNGVVNDPMDIEDDPMVIEETTPAISHFFNAAQQNTQEVDRQMNTPLNLGK